MTTLQEVVEEMKAARAKLRLLAQEQGKPILTEAAEPLRALGVTAIKWRQYTPYFNDGEACEFSVNDPAVRLAGVGDDEGDYEDGFVYSWNLGYLLKEGRLPNAEPSQVEAVQAALTEFGKMICSQDAEDFMFDLFGDHVTVTLRFPRVEAAFEVEDYDHD